MKAVQIITKDNEIGIIKNESSESNNIVKIEF